MKLNDIDDILIGLLFDVIARYNLLDHSKPVTKDICVINNKISKLLNLRMKYIKQLLKTVVCVKSLYEFNKKTVMRYELVFLLDKRKDAQDARRTARSYNRYQHNKLERVKYENLIENNLGLLHLDELKLLKKVILERKCE